MDEETHQIEQIHVTYQQHRYSIPFQIARQIGFLAGMIDSGLADDLELPQHENPVVAKMAAQVLGHLVSNPNQSYPINYLRSVILGGLSNQEYIAQIKNVPHQDESMIARVRGVLCESMIARVRGVLCESMIARVRGVLDQVFTLLVLADYWDCRVITMECTEFLTLHMSIAEPFSVKKWFAGIV
jgi:hypothetical protein